jgi:CIC family chloride channel protein
VQNRKFHIRILYLSGYAIPVGVVAALAAVGFRYLIGLIGNLLFLGELSFVMDMQAPLMTRWGAAVIVIPAIGILLASMLTRRLAPEARGHGVPEVMYAVVEDGGRIRPVVAFVKLLASALTIGSGGSAGTAGPIIQMGAGFGSSVAQIFKLSPREVVILVGAGVAGSVAATFNAPIGGLFFAIELILPEYSLMTIMPLVIASIVATHLTALLLGTSVTLPIPAYTLASSAEFPIYIVLGFVAALAAVLYIKGLYGAQNVFNRIRIHPQAKAVIGGLLVGAMGFGLFLLSGSYHIFGVGFPFISSILTGESFAIPLLIGLVLLKIVANGITLATGGSGGIFAPSLFVGAAVGAAVGQIANTLFPEIASPASAYALVGMAAVVAGTTGGTVTAITLTFELTRNYEIMLPLMLSVVIAHFASQAIEPQTIYTKKLSRRGIYIDHDKVGSLFKITPVREVTQEALIALAPHNTVSDAIRVLAQENLDSVPVISNGRVLGIVAYRDVFDSPQDEHIAHHYREVDISIPGSMDSLRAMEKMARDRCNMLVVTQGDEIVGYVTRSLIMNAYFEKRDLELPRGN